VIDAISPMYCAVNKDESIIWKNRTDKYSTSAQIQLREENE